MMNLSCNSNETATCLPLLDALLLTNYTEAQPSWKEDDMMTTTVQPVVGETESDTMVSWMSLLSYFAPYLLLYVLFVWYKRPRDRVRHLPIAPMPSSTTEGAGWTLSWWWWWWKQPFVSLLRFLGGHLIETCHCGLEKCSATWFETLRTPIVTYYHGRTPVVLIADPELAKTLLRTSNDRSLMDVCYESPVSLSTAQGKQWRSFRKIIMPKMYTIAKQSRPVIYQHCEKLRHILLKNHTDDEPESIDFLQVFRSLSLDIIAKLLFDVELNTLDGHNTDLLEDGNKISMAQVDANKSFLIQWSASLARANIEPLLNLASLLTTKNTLGKVVNGHIVESLKKQKQKTKDEQQATSTTWLDWWTNKFESSFVRATAYIFLQAALDNTAVAMATFFYHMAKNPNVQTKLYHEIHAHCYDNDNDNDNDSYKRSSSSSLPAKAATCQYLDWCIKESMRTFSHVSFYGRYASEDTTFAVTTTSKSYEYSIPKGTPCMIATDLLHHHPQHWGNDTHKFRPERFDPDSQEFKNRHSFAYLPLGYGRDCAGRALVSEQMKTTIATLLNDFEFRVDDNTANKHNKHKKMMDDPATDNNNKLYSETGLAKFPVNGVHLIIHPRNSGACTGGSTTSTSQERQQSFHFMSCQ